jgi:hypothetical protein
MFEINVGRVRELKGASLAVLMLLALAPQPVSKAWLARSSGYSDKPVKAACDYLLEQGLIECSHSGWCLATLSPETREEAAQYAEAVSRSNSADRGFSPTCSKPQTRNNSVACGAILTPAGSRTRNNSADRGFSPTWSKKRTRKNSDLQADIKTRENDHIRNNSTERSFSPTCSKPQTRNSSVSRGAILTLAGSDSRSNSADRGFSPPCSKPQTRNNSVSRGAILTQARSDTRNNSADAGFSHIWSKPHSRKKYFSTGSLKILSLKDLKELKDLKDFKDFNTTSITDTNRKNRQPAPKRADPGIPIAASDCKSSQVKAEIWAELSRIGLRKNARTEALAELEHVTPAYVRALAEKLQEQGRGGYRHTGLFVHACEQAEAVQPVSDPRRRGRAVQEAFDRFMNRG